jgi:hypothetical protein
MRTPAGQELHQLDIVNPSEFYLELAVQCIGVFLDVEKNFDDILGLQNTLESRHARIDSPEGRGAEPVHIYEVDAVRNGVVDLHNGDSGFVSDMPPVDSDEEARFELWDIIEIVKEIAQSLIIPDPSDARFGFIGGYDIGFCLGIHGRYCLL